MTPAGAVAALRGGAAARALDGLNARHPWSHNDAFHPWILRHLPTRRCLAVDVGCGQGALLLALAPRFERVVGLDVDPAMRADAGARCAMFSQVEVADRRLDEVDGPVDLVTMVASLHHLDVSSALAGVARVLAPGGGVFLCVGLAPVLSRRDLAWNLASAVTNPLIGVARHPRPVRQARPATGPAVPGSHPRAGATGGGDPFPVRDPEVGVDELRRLLAASMPGARLRRRLGFRHTIAWVKPGSPERA